MSLNDINSLSHTKWNCKYHIVFAPKYRRKVFYGEKRAAVGKILRQLCEWKGVKIVEAYDDHYAAYVIEKVAKAGMRIITNPPTNLMLQGRLDKQPIRRGITRVKELLDAGVTVCFGQDNLNDTFYPFGAANSLQLANLAAHAIQMTAPAEIEKLFDMITDDAAKILDLKDYGMSVGKKANFVILNAHDVREAIRLDSDRLYVIREGKVLAQTRREVDRMF